MMELQELQTTESSLLTGRKLWEKQRAAERHSRLEQVFQNTLWKPVEDYSNIKYKGRVKCVCICGKEAFPRVVDLLKGNTSSCRSCAMRLRVANVPAETRVQLAKKASAAAAKAAMERIDPYEEKYGAVEVRKVLSNLAGAKQRCCNPNNNAYMDYGLRGITFDFPSVRIAMEWVMDNLGPRISKELSLDRIDNNKGYEPGNLRWATRSEQARNKRMYKRTVNGSRIRKIMDLRKDLTYEAIRTQIKLGMTDEEILSRRKYQHGTS